VAKICGFSLSLNFIFPSVSVFLSLKSIKVGMKWSDFTNRGSVAFFMASMFVLAPNKNRLCKITRFRWPAKIFSCFSRLFFDYWLVSFESSLENRFLRLCKKEDSIMHIWMSWYKS